LVGGADPFRFEIDTFIKPKDLNDWEDRTFEYLKRKGEKGATRSFVLEDVKDSAGKPIPKGSIDRTLKSLRDNHNLICKDANGGVWHCTPDVFDEDEEEDIDDLDLEEDWDD
jgi:hypothetical protein